MPSSLNHRVRGLEVAGPALGDLPPCRAVQRDSRLGVALGRGLFPADEPGAQVLTMADGSRSGWTVRQLDGEELGGLWDVPILLLDALGSTGEDLAVRQALVGSAPGQLLQLSADSLLCTPSCPLLVTVVDTIETYSTPTLCVMRLLA